MYIDEVIDYLINNKDDLRELITKSSGEPEEILKRHIISTKSLTPDQIYDIMESDIVKDLIKYYFTSEENIDKDNTH